MEEVIIWVAIYGAILSSVALTWNIVSYLIDKPKIVPRYYTTYIPIEGEKGKHGFAITFSNPTKHRVVVSSAGILFKNNQNLLFTFGRQIFPDDLPKVLLQGDSHTLHRDIDDIKKAIDKERVPKYIWVRDVTGKTYKGSAKNMIKRVNAMYKVKHKK